MLKDKQYSFDFTEMKKRSEVFLYLSCKMIEYMEIIVSEIFPKYIFLFIEKYLYLQFLNAAIGIVKYGRNNESPQTSSY